MTRLTLQAPELRSISTLQVIVQIKAASSIEEYMVEQAPSRGRDGQHARWAARRQAVFVPANNDSQ